MNTESSARSRWVSFARNKAFHVDCCKGPEGKHYLFTPYGRMLLDDLAEFARTLDYRLVERAFTRTDIAA